MVERAVWRAVASEDYPNRLVVGAQPLPHPRWHIISLLLLLCFLPRAWEALHRETVWTDSITYHEASVALEHGNYDKAFEYLGLNIYPPILWAMRAAGLDWEVAGSWWSVLFGTLAVLPLYGWVRRQFDDRIALCAGALYAVHGRLIGMSAIVLRDAMFWFLLLATLYCAWRAIVELRWRHFLLGGVALTLCVHLRTEGWFVLPIAAVWAAVRFRALGRERLRLMLGCCATLAIIPLSVALVNLTVLRSHPQWDFVRRNHVTVVTNFKAPSPDVAAVALPQSDFETITIAKGMSPWKNGGKLVHQWIKAHGYLHFGLAVIGILAVWRVFFRRDHLAEWGIVGCLFAALWVRSVYSGCDVRYFLPAALVAFPWMGIGFFTLASALMRRLPQLTASRLREAAAIAGLLAVATVPALWEVELSWCKFMDGEAAIGRWIRHDIGPGVSIRTNTEDLRLVQYYSQSRLTEPFCVQAAMAGQSLDWLNAAPPDLVIVRADRKRGTAPYEQFAGSILDRGLGYQRVPSDRLPTACDGMIVLSRVAPPLAAAGRSTR